MITKEMALSFTEAWINAFNSHRLELILEHYADELEFYSPFIQLLNFNTEGVIRNKADLKKYFSIGLTTYPDLHFTLHQYFVGVNSLIIYYASVNNKLAAETLELNEHGKAVRVFCHYANHPEAHN